MRWDAARPCDVIYRRNICQREREREGERQWQITERDSSRESITVVARPLLASFMARES